MAQSTAPLKSVKRVQFGILSPDEIVSCGAHVRAHVLIFGGIQDFVYAASIGLGHCFKSIS